MADNPIRPPTPQTMFHRLPDKPDVSPEGVSTKPSKFVILIEASTAVAGKVQVAQSVSRALACPLFQGDSLHETAARAASVGATAKLSASTVAIGANEARYQRMWLSKMTRTGLLFPEESRPAGSGFAGFGGGSASTSTSRRGSDSSEASIHSFSAASDIMSTANASIAGSLPPYPAAMNFGYINRPPATAYQSEDQRLHRENPALLVLTHPKLESWHKDCIRKATGEYGIGVIFVPLDSNTDLPILKPLDPSTMMNFGPLGLFATVHAASRNWDEEIVLDVDVEAKVEDLPGEIIDAVRAITNE